MTELNNEFNLINGTFTGVETSELLSTLFTDKLRFHNIKNFSHKERLGKPDEYSEERIQKLKETHEKLLDFLKNFDGDHKFEICANITIKPVN
ncbi:MAG: hypothetical protein ACXVAY_07390 [Mucilaginibacter sp.]